MVVNINRKPYNSKARRSYDGQFGLAGGLIVFADRYLKLMVFDFPLYYR
jgi:hypothetical protein